MWPRHSDATFLSIHPECSMHDPLVIQCCSCRLQHKIANSLITIRALSLCVSPETVVSLDCWSPFPGRTQSDQSLCGLCRPRPWAMTAPMSHPSAPPRSSAAPRSPPAPPSAALPVMRSTAPATHRPRSLPVAAVQPSVINNISINGIPWESVIRHVLSCICFYPCLTTVFAYQAYMLTAIH